MLRALIIVLLGVCSTAQEWPLNRYWYNTNDMVSFLGSFDDLLPLTVQDAANKEKTAFSYMIRSILVYLVSNGTDIPARFDPNPSDVVAGDSRHYLAYLQAVLLPVTNVIKLVCRPDTPEDECATAVHYRVVDVEQEQCPGFAAHYMFHGDVVRLMEEPEFVSFVHLIRNVASLQDINQADIALQRVILAGPDYQTARQTILTLFQRFIDTDFKCAKPYFHRIYLN